MKIGDKVRFLSETGGGRISGFQGKNIVLVEDEDGFEIPTPVSEVVVVADEGAAADRIIANEAKRRQAAGEGDARSIRQRLNEGEEMADDWKQADVVNPEDDPSVGFEAPPKERTGGDRLSIYLAFVPQALNELSHTAFTCYLVNDSNYYVKFSYAASADGGAWKLRATGELEPNTKVFMEKISNNELNDLHNAAVQLFAYKVDKDYTMKPAMDIRFHVDGVKFYKLNTFRQNDFFAGPALLYTLVEQDEPMKANSVVFVEEPKEIRIKEERKQPARLEHPADGLVKRYSPGQSKSRKVKQVLKDDKIVVDLHANELLETTVGMSAGDILEYQLDVFRKVLDQYKSNKGQKIIFIHGKGEGVLRRAVIHELNYKYKQHLYQDASFREYGYGATQVIIR